VSEALAYDMLCGPARRPTITKRRTSIGVAALVALLAVPALLAAAHPAGTATAPVVAERVAPGVDPVLHHLGARVVPVIIQANPGQEVEAARAATALHATIGERLPMVDGLAARMAAGDAVRLGADPSVRAVTLNRHVRFDSFSYDDTTTASSFARTSGASQAWAQGNLGDGVGVAIIDTGLSSMNDFAGRTVFGPDLSGEGTTVDNYGHGTVMAGIIGGSGADSANNAAGAYTGVAPKATLVAVKAAGRNGAADVSTMLQAMHWVAAYKDQYNIRVLNLSWGTPSTQDPRYDPINYAVERLWGLGIVVVAAAGNNGPNSQTLFKPGDDPLAITVGSYDDKQNNDPGDDSLSAWSSRGPTPTGLVKPDIVAPGRTLIATRSYGSYVEQNYPKALVAPSYIKGSGTSEATAVVSGLAALMIKAHPTYTPDQVKTALKATASPLPNLSANQQGAGRVQLGAALSGAPGPSSSQTPVATGSGSIESSRGGLHVQADCHNDGTIDTIQGEIDVRCEAWNPGPWTGSAWTGASWTGASWTAGSWTAASWTGASWTGGTWTGGSWQGASWTGTISVGSPWSGASWTGASWTAASWTAASWTAGTWTSAGYDDLFLTRFWGPKAPPGTPGEPVDTNYPKPRRIR
jgi:serine protease AprX